MMFKEFSALLRNHFNQMVQDAPILFETDVDPDTLWHLYLDSFLESNNQLYRKSREHDCSCCRSFIKQMGHVVVLKNGLLQSLWDFSTGSNTFQPVINALSAYVKSKPVVDVFHAALRTYGTGTSYELVDGQSRAWHHLSVELPTHLVDYSRRSAGEYKGHYRDIRNVFKRSLDEISLDSVLAVRELIAQNSLYKGEEWQAALDQFLRYKQGYDQLPNEQAKDLYAWEGAISAGAVVGKIRNHSMGTLLVHISEGMELDEAVRRYEALVAPAHYKRPKAIFTAKMVEEAQRKMEELGFADSLGRRYATLDDITVNNILFANKDAAQRLGDADVFSTLSSEAQISPKRFDHCEEISIDQLIRHVLPTAKEVEVCLENRMHTNLVSLIAPQNPAAKSMFKWGNAFGWAYAGNMTDSALKENVKAAGGNVDGALRFSIQWNDEDHNANDFDAYCMEPSGNQIYYAHKVSSQSGGNLDVDIQRPLSGTPAVENITWPSKQRMMCGQYVFSVHNFSHRGGRSGFKAEIAYDDTTFTFTYNKELCQDERVNVAIVTLDANGHFTIKEEIPASMAVRDMWGVQTHCFVPASVIMYSPNYWDGQQGIGHRHVFFMLKGCVNPESPNGFYNEFLCNDLMAHKRVLEALGAKLRVADTPDQLSGVGFSTTKRDTLIVRVTGATKRILKVTF